MRLERRLVLLALAVLCLCYATPPAASRRAGPVLRTRTTGHSETSIDTAQTTDSSQGPQAPLLSVDRSSLLQQLLANKQVRIEVPRDSVRKPTVRSASAGQQPHSTPSQHPASSAKGQSSVRIVDVAIMAQPVLLDDSSQLLDTVSALNAGRVGLKRQTVRSGAFRIALLSQEFTAPTFACHYDLKVEDLQSARDYSVLWKGIPAEGASTDSQSQTNTKKHHSPHNCKQLRRVTDSHYLHGTFAVTCADDLTIQSFPDHSSDPLSGSSPSTSTAPPFPTHLIPLLSSLPSSSQSTNDSDHGAHLMWQVQHTLTRVYESWLERERIQSLPNSPSTSTLKDKSFFLDVSSATDLLSKARAPDFGGSDRVYAMVILSYQPSQFSPFAAAARTDNLETLLTSNKCFFSSNARSGSKHWPLTWLHSVESHQLITDLRIPTTFVSDAAEPSAPALPRTRTAITLARLHKPQTERDVTMKTLLLATGRDLSTLDEDEQRDMEDVATFLELGDPGPPPPVFGLLAIVAKVLLNPMLSAAIEYFGPMVTNEMNADLRGTTDTGVVEDIVEITSPPVARNATNLAADGITYFATRKITYMITKALGPRMATHIADGVFPHLRDRLNDTMCRTISYKLRKVIPQGMDRSIPIAMIPKITHPVSRALVATLSHSLQNMRVVWFFCGMCKTQKLWCDYCKMSNKNYYSTYYSTYYTDYYAPYYTDYYTEAMKMVDKAQFSPFTE